MTEAARTSVNLDQLEALARAATPGPWTTDYESRNRWRRVALCEEDGGDGSSVYSVAKRMDCEADAAYIAAASPDVILRLIALAHAAEAWRDLVDGQIVGRPGGRTSLPQVVALLDAIDALGVRS